MFGGSNLRTRRVHPWSAALLLCIAGPAPAAEFYIATNGSDANAGSLNQPFASLQRAQQAAAPGDTVWVRGGVYEFTAAPGSNASANAVLFNKSGTPGNRINYFAMPGEQPVFDFFNYLPTQRIRGFSVQADYLHFKGLELRGVQQTITNVNESWAIRLEGNGADFNIFEQLDLHHNEGPGLFIQNGGNNLVLNSDSHDNYDPDRGGENADGFGSHSNDDGNVFVGNRAWSNSDDGFDFINSSGRVELHDSIAFSNGYVPGTDTRAGNGAGIKAGGFGLNSATFPDPQDVPRNLIQGNIAFDNRVQGFYANHHPGGIDWINNTAFANAVGFDLLNDVEIETWAADHFLRNNISFDNNDDLRNAIFDLIDSAFNTWDGGFDVSAEDFVSLSMSLALAPRLPDGSLPDLGLLRLAAGSDLIDAGLDVGLPFNGTAPDLGAFETSGPLSGDLDGDGFVGVSDLNVVLGHWNQNVTPGDPLLGDPSGDGFVGIGDLGFVLGNWNAGAPPVASAVPEPSTLALVSLIGLVILRP